MVPFSFFQAGLTILSPSRIWAFNSSLGSLSSQLFPLYLGSLNLKHEPFPRVLSHQILPPRLSIYSLATARPYPVDGSPPVGLGVSWDPGSKSLLWSVSLIPGPSSQTLHSTHLFLAVIWIFTDFPGFEYLVALESKLSSTAAVITRSAHTRGRSIFELKKSRILFWSAIRW